MPKLQDDFMRLAGISILDPETNGLRSTYDIISDMARILPTLDPLSRGFLMEKAAGQRQVAVLEAIIQNWQNVEKATESAKNSTGSALRENEKYLNSIEGKMNKMTSAWQQLSKNTIDSDFTKTLIDAGTELIKLIDKLGLINTIIVSVTVVAFAKWGLTLPIITQGIYSLATALGVASGAAVTLSYALTGGLIGIAIVGAIIAFKALTKSAIDTYEAFEKLKSQAEANRDELKSLADEYESLANKQEKNSDDLVRLLNIQSLVNIKYGAAKEGITLYSDAIDNNSKAIQNNIDWLKRRAEFEAREFLIRNKRTIEEAKKGLSESIRRDPTDVFGYESPKTLYEERDYLSKRLELEGDLFGLTQRRLDKINDEIYAYEQILLVAEEYRNLLIFINDVSPDFSDAGVHNMLNSLGIVGELTEQYKGLTDTLKSLGETSDIVYSTIRKNAEGTLTFADIQKLGESYEDYIDILEIEGDRVSINTDKLQEYNIANIEASLSKAQLALATDTSNEKLQKEVLVLEAYLSQAKKATDQSRDFVNNFNTMIDTVTASMSKEELSGGFDILSRKLIEVNGQFEDGVITAKEYADGINDALKSIDFDQVFKSKDSAEIFFSGMVANAAQSLSQMNSEFNAGSILFSEYTDSLVSFAGVMDTISGLTQNLAEAFGDAGDIVSTIADETTGGFSRIADGMRELQELQETNVLMESAVAQIRSAAIQQGTEDYNILMDKIAESAWATSQNWVDMDGQAFTSAENLATYLKGSTSNFFNFANQTASASGTAIKNIMTGAGTVLEALGKAIQNFDAKITFTPKLKGPVDFAAIIGGKPINDWFQMPSIEFDITGSGGESVQGLGKAISAFGSSLIPKSPGGGWRDAGAGVRDDGDPFGFDWTIYEKELNQVSGNAGKAANAAKDLEDALGGAGKVAKEDQKSIADLFNLVIDKIKQEKKEQKELLKQQQETIKAQQEALKEQLNAYKDIIDVRKALLDTQKEELNYADEIADKNKSIARLQDELATLALDDSLESQARQLELKNELAEQMEDLARTQRDHQFDEQKTALDAEYETYRKSIEIQDALLQQQYDAIDLQIKIIEEFLSKSGIIAQEALRRIAEQAPGLYQSLIDWNSEYGSGIDRDVTDAWNEAYEALSRYVDLIDALRGTSEYGDVLLSTTFPTHHTGLASGPVGGVKTPTNEVFSKLMAGEIILNENDMLGIIRRIPEIAGKLQTASTPMGLTIAGNLINIEGNVDENVMEDIKKIADKVMNQINQSLLRRGYTRGAQLFQF